MPSSGVAKIYILSQSIVSFVTLNLVNPRFLPKCYELINIIGSAPIEKFLTIGIPSLQKKNIL
jgi:hypothetical protein